MTSDTFTFEQYLEWTIEACERWESFGHKVSRTRIGAYEKLLAELVKMGPEGRGNLKPPHLGENILTFGEIKEFLFVSQIATAKPHLANSPRIKKIFNGPDLARDEGRTGHLSRNTLFELTVACLIEKAGMNADISGETDVKTSFEGYSILIECKRPQNLRKAERNIDSAAAQFWKRPSQPPFFNLIALCLGKAITEGDRILIANSREEIVEHLEYLTEVFRISSRRHWTEKKHISGLLTRVMFSGENRFDKLPFNADLFQLTNNPHLSSSEVEILARFSSTISSALPGAKFP